jgi:hypothetical protein
MKKKPKDKRKTLKLPEEIWLLLREKAKSNNRKMVAELEVMLKH